jgi:hypothetical protein
MPNAVQYKDRTVNVGTIPIGIDPEKFTDVPTHPFLISLSSHQSLLSSLRVVLSLPPPTIAFPSILPPSSAPLAYPRPSKNQNVKPASRNWKKNSREKRLLLE